MLPIGQINNAFIKAFNSLKEGQAYELTTGALSDLNELRKQCDRVSVESFIFYRIKDSLSFKWNWFSPIEIRGTDYSLYSFFNNLNNALGLPFAFAFTMSLIEGRFSET